MVDQSLLSALEADEEYRIIEQALLETPRGRWFLTEHGRRSRRVDSTMLEDAVRHLQSSLREPPALLSVLRTDVERLQSYSASERENLQATSLASGEPATGNEGHFPTNMLAVAEDLHALVWSMRDQVPTEDLCEAIARQSARIYALSHAQAIESAHAAHVTVALDETQSRLASLLETILAEMQPHSAAPRRPAYLPSSR